MKGLAKTVLFFAAMLALAGCSPKSYVVLMENQDGTTGKLAVSGEKTETLLSQPRTAAALSGKSEKPFMVDEQKIQKDFAGALSAQPLLPVSFMLYFEAGGALLTNESKALIPSIVEAARKYPAPDVSVIGHTDTMGDKDYNEQISLQRAKTVAQIIRDAGIQVHDLTIESHGERNLLIPTPDNTPEPRNRRVEITVR